MGILEGNWDIRAIFVLAVSLCSLTICVTNSMSEYRIILADIPVKLDISVCF